MAKMSPLILLIEDELPIRRFLRTSLASEDYRLTEAETGQAGIRVAAQQPPDLVILDLGLPDVDGQDVLRQLRESLDNGADDYLTKPFSTAELLARIRVALRHAAKLDSDAESSTFVTGNLKVDFADRKVYVKGEEVHLTPLEYKLLTTLAKHAGKVLTHRFLLNEIWGPLHGRETHYLRVFMASLRRKIEVDAAEPRILLTEQGIGYRLAAD